MVPCSSFNPVSLILLLIRAVDVRKFSLKLSLGPLIPPSVELSSIPRTGKCLDDMTIALLLPDTNTAVSPLSMDSVTESKSSSSVKSAVWLSTFTILSHRFSLLAGVCLHSQVTGFIKVFSISSWSHNPSMYTTYTDTPS